MDADDLCTIGHFTTLAEAAMARNRLESEEVRATIADDYMVTTDPLLAGAVNYVKVQVRRVDFERALAILAEPAAEIELDQVADEEADPEADSGDDEFPVESEGERLVRFAYRAALFGCISLPFILHLYSLYLLLKIAIFHPELPPGATARYYVALLVNVGFVGFAALLFMAIFAN